MTNPIQTTISTESNHSSYSAKIHAGGNSFVSYERPGAEQPRVNAYMHMHHISKVEVKKSPSSNRHVDPVLRFETPGGTLDMFLDSNAFNILQAIREAIDAYEALLTAETAS